MQKCKNCSQVCVYHCTQHSTEQQLSPLSSSRQETQLRCYLLEGRGDGVGGRAVIHTKTIVYSDHRIVRRHSELVRRVETLPPRLHVPTPASATLSSCPRKSDLAICHTDIMWTNRQTTQTPLKTIPHAVPCLEVLQPPPHQNVSCSPLPNSR